MFNKHREASELSQPFDKANAYSVERSRIKSQENPVKWPQDRRGRLDTMDRQAGSEAARVRDMLKQQG